MKKSITKPLIAFVAAVFLVALSTNALAVPTAQVYSEDGYATSLLPDEDSWVVDGMNPFSISVVGNYGTDTDTVFAITDARLIISVVDGESGTLSITSLEGGNPDPVLLNSLDGSGIPAIAADEDLLTNVGGLDGYDTIQPPDSFTGDYNTNNHWPLHNDLSDFLVYDIGDFADDVDTIYDYNADDGVITLCGQCSGEVKEYSIEYSGFTRLHIDVFMKVWRMVDSKEVWAWEINPPSHDVTVVPEPSTLLLLGSGLIALGIIRKRFGRAA